MLRKILIGFLLVLLALTAVAQTATDKVRQYALELGIPIEELQRLVDKYNTNNQSGFKDNRAGSAQVIDIDEAEFLQDSKRLVVGKLYRISCLFFSQSGTTVHLTPSRSSIKNFLVRVDSLLRIERNTSVEVLLQCISNTGYDSFKIIEVIVN
jgi:hypothetical protein